MENTTRIKDGISLAEHIWWTLAKSIVKKAGELYKWNDEEWTHMQETFLRNNDYKVVLSHVNL